MKSINAPRSPMFTALPPIWNIPALRHPYFTGRVADLSTLADRFFSERHPSTTQVVRGMGGVGKTQIALTYACRYAKNYQAVWWLRAGDEQTLAADYAAFAAAANLKAKHAQRQQTTIDAVRGWLDQNRDWLFIFDNVKKPADVRDYLPRGTTGHVLITSRYQAWEKLCRSISVDSWSRTESVEFLVKCAKNEDPAGAEHVAEALGGLPLALTLVAAYVSASGIRFGDYLKRYHARRDELWGKKSLPLNYPDSVGTTLSLAIDKIREETPIAPLVLNLCANLGPDDIPYSMIAEANKLIPEESPTLFGDASSLRKGIDVLNRYSLVAAKPESLSTHRMVQAVVQDRLQEGERKIWSEVAIRTVNGVFPSASEGYRRPDRWQEYAALLAHGRVAIDHAIKLEVALETAADLHHRIGAYLHERASFSEAEVYFRGCLKIHETRLGAGNPEIAGAINNLAIFLWHQGRYAEAEPLFRRLLEFLEAHSDPGDPDIATGLNNLAMLLQDQGKYARAEALFRKALEIYETQLGVDHPSVAACLNNLAFILQDQGKYADAEPLYRRALIIRETQLGTDHPDVAGSLNNLALLLQDRDEYGEAGQLYRRALKIEEARYGIDHPSIADNLHFQASLLQVQGKHQQAEALFRQALEIYETQLGDNHPSIATCLNNLALSLQDQGKYSDAEPLYRRALTIKETQLGTDHPSITTCLNNLALLLQHQGKLADAEPLCRRALAIEETHLGADHPDVAISLDNLAGLLKGQGELKQAKNLSRKVSAAFKQMH